MGDLEQDYFVAGMHHALISDLSKIGALRVISRTSVRGFKGTDKTVPEIAQELGVEAVIEGSVLRAGNRVRITAQLIDAQAEQPLWSERYERDLNDVLSLQGEVVRAIAEAIKIAVTPEEQKRLFSAGPINDDAYLKGSHFLEVGGAVHVRKAMEHFERALEKDPDSALAYTGLADAYNNLSLSQGPAKKLFPRAKEFADKALRLDDSLAEAHTAMGYIQMVYEWDWSEAERSFKRALELKPGHSDAHAQYADLLTVTGRSEKALAEMALALELSPLSPYRNMHVVFLLLAACRTWGYPAAWEGAGSSDSEPRWDQSGVLGQDGETEHRVEGAPGVGLALQGRLSLLKAH